MLVFLERASIAGVAVLSAAAVVVAATTLQGGDASGGATHVERAAPATTAEPASRAVDVLGGASSGQADLSAVPVTDLEAAPAGPEPDPRQVPEGSLVPVTATGLAGDSTPRDTDTVDSAPVEVATQAAVEEVAAEEDDASAPVYVTDDDTVAPERVRSFLAGRGAPLAEYAEEIVAAGVEHDVDPRLVVGIAVAESSGGERLPAGTYNAWGWSGTGPHGLKAWPSWPEAIDDFTARLGELYDTDEVDESMAQTYVPPNWRWWLDTVTWVMDEI